MAVPVKKSAPFREMYKLRDFKIATLLAVLAWLAMLALLIVRVLPIVYGKTAIPLHYNIHVGVDAVGPWWKIFTAPAIGLMVLVANLFLARFMWTRDQAISHVVVFATVVMQYLLLAATVFIVYLSLQYA
ncbi:MAG: hypothetical protein WAZ14_02355 [Patescibacteria group bacterium]